jgi:AcrR family transcriptional regulator
VEPAPPGLPQAPRPNAAPATATAILTAARTLALDVGFRRTTIADVARRAGVSRMTVYREFDDIGAIWSRLLTDELVGLLDESSAELARLPTARAQIIGAAERLVEGIGRHPLFRRALDVDPELLLPLVVDRFGSTQRAVLARLEVLIRAGQADGSVRADLDPSSAACALLLSAQSFVFSVRALDTRPDADAVRAELAALIDRYLAP